MTTTNTAHYFEFSSNWDGPNRRCGACGKTYDGGDHIEINTLKSYTDYVCPTGGGYGHSSIWTGAYLHSLRTLRDHLCTCGAELVEKDNERWRVTWEMANPWTGNWEHHENVQSKYDAEAQHCGLVSLISAGEEIRNVRLEKEAS